MSNPVTPAEIHTFNNKFHYFVGWSYVDFKRFRHFVSDGGANQLDCQISFLCPNRAHHDWLVGFLQTDLKWDASNYRTLRGESYGGHSIVMLNVKHTYLEDLLKVPFSESLMIGDTHFLRGYLDHQVVAPRYRRANVVQSGRKNHFVPYPPQRACGLRMSFSSKEHLDAVSVLCNRMFGPDLFELQPCDENESKSPLVWVFTEAAGSLLFLSWLATTESDELPRFSMKHIITKLSKFVRHDTEPLSLAVASRDQPTPGFTMSFPATGIDVDPGIWGGPVFTTIKSESRLPDLPVWTKSNITLQVSKRASNPVLALAFLKSSTVAAIHPDPKAMIAVNLIYFGPIENIPPFQDLEFAVDHRQKEWTLVREV